MKSKRSILLCLALVLSMAMALNTTLAYLQDSDSDVNVMTLGNVYIDQIEDFEQGTAIYPNTEVKKEVTVKNTGKSDAYFRTLIAIEDLPESETFEVNVDATSIMAHYTSYFESTEWAGWPVGRDIAIGDKHYNVWVVTYNDVLEPGETSEPSLTKVGFGKTCTNDDMAALSDTFDVLVMSQAVQVEGFEAETDENGNVTKSAAEVALDAGFGEPTDENLVKWFSGEEFEIPNYITTEEELIEALTTGGTYTLGSHIVLTKTITIPSGTETSAHAVTINGNGFALTRDSSNTDTMISMGEYTELTLNNITVDGKEIESTGNLIYVDSNSTLTLNDGAVLQNHNGTDSAIHTDGSTTIIMNDGAVIQNNRSTNSAPAITGGLETTFDLNGGKITGNTTATGGASAIWSGNWSIMTISDTFELTNNYSEGSSSAIRFCSQTHFTMTGGTISGNANANNSAGAIYGWDTSMELFGGTIKDNGANAIDFDGGRGMTIGEINTNDTIVFGMTTNHDSVYLAPNFNTIYFNFDGTNTFPNILNFVPAEGYVYTEGDEDKLICVDEGYEVYWDVESNTFKLQATN